MCGGVVELAEQEILDDSDSGFPGGGVVELVGQ